MAALGKGNSRIAGGRWRRRAIRAAVVAVAATAVAATAQPAHASQDPMFPVQWNLRQIGAPQAWARSTGKAVRIGIVDSGVFSAQEDLAGKVVAATDCIDTRGDPGLCHGSGQDDSGHGTHMAGVAAATKDNGRGIAGVAPDAQLVVARVLTDDGGSIADVEAGIRWVVRHGAQVVNLSLADNPRAQQPLDLSFSTAVEEAWAAGVVPVVAAGNITSLGPDREDYAALDALVVGATDVRANVVSYSNPLLTTKWGVVAPGGSGTGDGRDVLSTWLNPGALAFNLYAYRGGASVAAAHVSGVVALLLAEGLSPAQAVQRILATAKPMACGGGCYGEVNAAAAVATYQPPVAVASAEATTPAPVTSRPTAVPSTASSKGPPGTAVQEPPDRETEVAAPVAIGPAPVAATENGRTILDFRWQGIWASMALIAVVVLSIRSALRNHRLRE